MPELEFPVDLETLQTFKFERILSESTTTGSVFLLGILRDVQAIVHLQRTVLDPARAAELVKEGFESIDVFLDNRPYFSAHALLSRAQDPLPDLQVKLIWPATETHVRKYSAQERMMVTETPETYEEVVVPYINSFPPERIEWVYNILDGKKEVDRVLYKDPHPEMGFVILPDLKWDQTSMNALYLTVIVQTKSIRSLRDLTRDHLALLERIRSQVHMTVKEKYEVEPQKLRLFVHYQPSYYHFHVHVAHIAHEGSAGMMVGQAHLLDELISLLKLSPPPPAPSHLQRMTFTYPLGVEHGLYAGMNGKQPA